MLCVFVMVFVLIHVAYFVTVIYGGLIKSIDDLSQGDETIRLKQLAQI